MTPETETPTQLQLRQAAMLLLAVDEVLWDNETLARAVEHAQTISDAVDGDPLWANGRHEGDCTQHAHTCARCLIEKYENDACALYMEGL